MCMDVSETFFMRDKFGCFAPQAHNVVHATLSMLQYWHWTLFEVVSSSSKCLFGWRSRVSMFGVSCHLVCGTCSCIAHGVFFQQEIFPDNLCNRGTIFHGAVTYHLSDGACDTAPRILALMWTTFLTHSSGIVLKQMTQADKGLVELEVLPSRSLHVHNVDRVEVKPSNV